MYAVFLTLFGFFDHLYPTLHHVKQWFWSLEAQLLPLKCAAGSNNKIIMIFDFLQRQAEKRTWNA